MISKKTVHIDEIVPYWRNPRDNNENAIIAVAKSIEKFGYQAPILVDSKMTIIAGHTRYKALRRLRTEYVEVVVSDMSQKQAKEYRIVDNRTNEYSNWIIDNVLAEYEEIKAPDLLDDLFPTIRGKEETEEQEEEYISPREQAKTLTIEDNDYIEIICPNCFNGFEMTYKEFKKLCKEQNKKF